MRVLHVITKPDELMVQVAEVQRADATVETENLTVGPVDYSELLEKIFGADSIHVW